MKKDSQKYINQLVTIAMKNIETELGYGNYITAHRLYKCNAKVHETDDYVILQSYNTEIAIYNQRTCALYDGLRYVYGYTATSARHYAKFKQWLKEHGYEIAMEFRYYDI